MHSCYAHQCLNQRPKEEGGEREIEIGSIYTCSQTLANAHSRPTQTHKYTLKRIKINLMPLLKDKK